MSRDLPQPSKSLLDAYPYLPETVIHEQVKRFTRSSGVVHEVRLHEVLQEMNEAEKHASEQQVPLLQRQVEEILSHANQPNEQKETSMTPQPNSLVVTKQTGTKVVIPATPGIIFKQNGEEYDHSAFEAATEARIRPILEKLGVRFLCASDVPEKPIVVTLDGIDFKLSRTTKDRSFTFPKAVCEHLDTRIAKAKQQGIAFSYFLYGEEDEPPDTFIYESDWQRYTFNSDPCVIGIVKTAPKRGLWFLLDKW